MTRIGMKYAPRNGNVAGSFLLREPGSRTTFGGKVRFLVLRTLFELNVWQTALIMK